MRTSTAIISFGSALFFVLALGGLVRDARKQGRVTTELGAFLASLSIGWLEAVIDWGSFLRYSPAWPLHIPNNWPVFGLVPVLPVPVILAYTWFYFGLAWIGTLIGRRLHRRWPHWGRLRTVALPTFLLVFGTSFVVEAICIALGTFKYTKTWALVSVQAGTTTQHPLTMDLAMALTITPLAWVMSCRNRNGEDPIQSFVRRRLVPLARYLRQTSREPAATVTLSGGRASVSISAPAGGRGRVQTTLVVIVWIAALHAVYVPVSLGYCVLRWTDVQTAASPVRANPARSPLSTADTTGAERTPSGGRSRLPSAMAEIPIASRLFATIGASRASRHYSVRAGTRTLASCERLSLRALAPKSAKRSMSRTVRNFGGGPGVV